MQLSYQARSRIQWKGLDLHACKTLHQSTTASTSEAKPGVERNGRVVSGSAVEKSDSDSNTPQVGRAWPSQESRRLGCMRNRKCGSICSLTGISSAIRRPCFAVPP